ncbi:hypothetical protein EVAR_13483_1 [Eumeta japonica]|uniref:Uncharacterized protein n=1 Tax=Eumeta variegata TaxID=151549 RepID=A0A4C1UXZ2_EUMVA|nr:hypothetical protein EVAR_13483_1 [Eumeta japonica]
MRGALIYSAAGGLNAVFGQVTRDLFGCSYHSHRLGAHLWSSAIIVADTGTASSMDARTSPKYEASVLICLELKKAHRALGGRARRRPSGVGPDERDVGVPSQCGFTKQYRTNSTPGFLGRGPLRRPVTEALPTDDLFMMDCERPRTSKKVRR